MTIVKSKNILNNWLQRDITIFEKTLLTKISRFIYPAQSLALSTKLVKERNKLNFDFSWKNRNHYIRKGDLLKSYEEGSIKAIDFEIMDGVFKIKWLQIFLQNANEIWFCLTSLIFYKLGGIQFLLKCDFEIQK